MNEKAQMVDSTGDRRVVNNAMRHQYRVLTDAEKEQMQRLKDMGVAFVEELQKMQEALYREDIRDYVSGELGVIVPQAMNWELQNAHRSIEEAVMWAVKHLTR